MEADEGGQRRRRRRRPASVEDRGCPQAELFVAASRGRVQGVRQALERGAAPDEVALAACVCGLPEDGCVCLGYSPLHCAAQAGSAGAVYLLLAADADPNVLSGRVLFGLRPGPDGLGVADGFGPLHVAAACGHRRVAELLIRHHADPHRGAVEPRMTPLGFALGAGHAEVADMLRQEAAAQVALRAALPPGGPEAFVARQGRCHGSPGAAAEVAGNPRMEALLRRVRARACVGGERDEPAGSGAVAAAGA